MKTRLFGMLAAVLLSIGASAQSEDYALANFDHEVTQLRLSVTHWLSARMPDNCIKTITTSRWSAGIR